MKLLFIILFSIAGLSVNAQNSKKDTLKVVQAEVTDSTLILSVNDLKLLYEKLQELPYKQAAPFINHLNVLINEKVEQYRKRKAAELNKRQ